MNYAQVAMNNAIERNATVALNMYWYLRISVDLLFNPTMYTFYEHVVIEYSINCHNPRTQSQSLSVEFH